METSVTEASVKRSRNILVVARWPLGGIRTYMRYMFRHFPQEYGLNIFAPSTHEDEALKSDVREYDAKLLLTKREDLRGLSLEIIKELKKNSYDLILSQGFISAVAASLANLFFKIPHILTIHGIVEPKFLTGRLAPLKRFVLKKMLLQLSAIYAVSDDILKHLCEEFPALKEGKIRLVVIPNGIDITEFSILDNGTGVREKLGISESKFVFGFFGRFMPQKGFDLLIDAIEKLRERKVDRDFCVLAVGSGDCIGRYKKSIAEKRLEQLFYFLPFQPSVHSLYPDVDTIVMPSRWEASGLLAMEALCMGRPLIAADCIGLRETVLNTPAKMFESENVSSLADMLFECLSNPTEDAFAKYAKSARQRYDVASSAHKFVQLIEEVC